MNRSGTNFANTTLNKMLKNIAYLGILRSGDSQSEIFPKLQIIDPATFERAQEIMKQRTMKHSDVPFNSKGKALLVGKLYCGHCGSKLILTTSGRSYYRADGTYVKGTRLRYQCHYRVHHPQSCAGQNGYSVDKLDALIETTILKLFETIKTIPEEEMIQGQLLQQETDFKSHLTRTQLLCRTKEKELQDYKSEVLKVIHGESSLNMEIINQLVSEAQIALAAAQKEVEHWQLQIHTKQETAADLHSLYSKVLSWSELFTLCSIEEKKMIIAQLIKEVRIKKNYELEIDFNVMINQILGYQQTALSA